MYGAGLRMPASAVVTTIAEALERLDEVGLPCIVRPAFTLGGRGGGIARDARELEAIVGGGLEASPISQVLLDQSVLGWGEFELEVMRDSADNAVVVCSIENVDPMGVHTGDSVTVAPQQTLPDALYQRLRDQALTVIRAVGVETGGSNVQFAVDPESEEILVIEMNPRVSRSSALASKATGFPIAKIAARLAVGYTLEEIPNDITGITPASFEPTIDYVVVKYPRFAFEKFPGAPSETLSTHMKSVGEVMAIGRTFGQAFAKAMRSRELDKIPQLGSLPDAALLERLAVPHPERFETILELFRRDVALERGARAHRDPPVVPRRAPRARARPARPLRRRALVSLRRHLRGGVPRAHALLLLGVRAAGGERGARSASAQAVVVLGSGPNRIGQGIEFDYCCVHAAMTVRELGREAVMINCNPETVSTDYDISDRLYFEPLTLEDVLAVLAVERNLEGVIVQFGGQTPLKLAAGLERAGVRAAGNERRGDRPRRGPRPLRPAARRARLPGAALCDGRARSQRRWSEPRTSATRCSCAPPTCSAGARWRSSTRARASRTTCAVSSARCRRPRATRMARPPRRSSSTASSSARSRSTSTRSATARLTTAAAARCGSGGSCSTSRRPASTRATAPAYCRRTRSTRS